MDALWGAERDSPEREELDRLADLIEIYEEKRYPSPPVDPVALLEGYMDNLAITPQALAELLEVEVEVVEELLGRKRRFTSRIVNVLVKELEMDRDWFHQDLLAQQAQATAPSSARQESALPAPR